MLLGIVETNQRRHLVGVWRDTKHIKESLHGLCTVHDAWSENEPDVKYYIELHDAYLDHPEAKVFSFGDHRSDIIVYEYHNATAPGFLGGDED